MMIRNNYIAACFYNIVLMSIFMFIFYFCTIIVTCFRSSLHRQAGGSRIFNAKYSSEHTDGQVSCSQYIILLRFSAMKYVLKSRRFDQEYRVICFDIVYIYHLQRVGNAIRDGQSGDVALCSGATDLCTCKEDACILRILVFSSGTEKLALDSGEGLSWLVKRRPKQPPGGPILQLPVSCTDLSSAGETRCLYLMNYRGPII